MIKGYDGIKQSILIYSSASFFNLFLAIYEFVEIGGSASAVVVFSSVKVFSAVVGCTTACLDGAGESNFMRTSLKMSSSASNATMWSPVSRLALIDAPTIHIHCIV